MKICWSTHAWEDYLHWQATDPEMVNGINALIRDIQRDPFRGLGKPEPLKHKLHGWWSRRITREHRIIYRVSGTGDAQQIDVVQCRYHY